MITRDLRLTPSASAKNLIEKSTQQKESISSGTNKEEVSENYRKAIFTKRHLFTLAATFFLLIGGAFSVYILQPQFEEMNLSRMDTLGGMILLVLGGFLLIFRLSFLAYIAKLFFSYKPVNSVTDEELPTCTVIVPAYNEGKQVYATLLSLTNSDFPAEKLQLIAIDDGSGDDTWEWMKKAKEQLGDRVSIYQQPHNQGKRHALYRGFNLATGEVFVTVDSDSIVEKDTLRNLVSPFVTNKDCGAVAGNVRVLNNEKAIIPRMLNVSFVFSFEFIRSAQSVLGSVLCTPGALAAYRSNAVMNCLPEWINQTFMGQPTDIGEDRAMTNMILKQGFHVLFQRNAYVLTNIPEKFSSLHKMFTRWERSNVRENLMMSRFAFKPFRNGSKSGTRLLLINQWMHMLTAYPLFVMMLVLLVLHPVMFISSTLLSILIFSSLPVIFYAKKYNISEALWAYSYSIFYTFGLFWITPYAMATANRRGWLTRELPQKK
ncbi:glycosyltransferase [Salegentibacter sp. F188]|uniref:N-acetylglucosaminyltransferase n=1 Tax=Autumnicola patrickiae TaxID=3075591 RepID=A0ABU3E2T8_9FLAO|nr:glycosyltransferase [Salegentibacter sp. F188]MDT0690288.1 glycosyltransferase [Salegentibacter sp. F188]